ncbi:hypothetical protein LP417_11130 [Polaromonas sp. P1-6]|nr:hypothetical protein LP417_11130 [Polaromonas sp. P1-6]
MLRYLITAFLICTLSACAGLGLGTDNRKVQNTFDTAKARLDQKARTGEITWVQAATQTRELDKYFARRTDLDTTWKYDQDDEEYHAYCIALAERLDRKLITFSEFDAARIQRFNAIQARRQSLNAQQRIIQNTQQSSGGASGRGVTCFKQREWNSGFNKNCVYSCLGSDAVQTIGAAELCPLSIVR